MFARKRTTSPADRRPWVLAAIAAPAFVATWSGWVGLGEKAGFGPVRMLPGIADQVVLNTAITLPIGIEAYAAYALGVWLSSKSMSDRTRRFAMVSGISSLVLGALGQVAYHLLEAYGRHVAPWQIVVGVACLPIAVVGMTAALVHLLRADTEQPDEQPRTVSPPSPAPPVAPVVEETAPQLPTAEPAVEDEPEAPVDPHAAQPEKRAEPRATVTPLRAGQPGQRELAYRWYVEQVAARGGDPNSVSGPEVAEQFGKDHLKKKITEFRQRLQQEQAAVVNE